MLTEIELAHYTEQGYLVCPGLLSREVCEEACAQLSVLIEEVGEQCASGQRAMMDFWSLMARSRGSIEVFADPRRPLPPAQELEGATMRVGHALHLHDPVFRALCQIDALRSAMRQLVGGAGQLLQSAVIYKQPTSDLVQFGMHQDAWYLPNEPESLLLAFVALDDMDAENGCLELLPGSHRHGRTGTLGMGPKGYFPAAGSAPREPSGLGAVSLPVERGAVIFVHGRAYHASAANRSTRPRRALVLHAMGASSTLLDCCWLLDRGAVPAAERL